VYWPQGRCCWPQGREQGARLKMTQNIAILLPALNVTKEEVCNVLCDGEKNPCCTTCYNSTILICCLHAAFSRPHRISFARELCLTIFILWLDCRLQPFLFVYLVYLAMFLFCDLVPTIPMHVEVWITISSGVSIWHLLHLYFKHMLPASDMFLTTLPSREMWKYVVTWDYTYLLYI
jgi:hypothetical protein